MRKLKNQILELKEKGLNYNQIQKELNCSKSVIAYHCGEGQKEKTRIRSQALRNNPIQRKKETFQNRERTKSFENRINTFQRNRKGDKKRIQTFSWQEVLSKFGKEPRCYLTGRKIDLNDINSYQFDHIVPISKGGLSTLDNLGLTCSSANLAKHTLSVNELLDLCQEILVHHGYKIIK